MWYSTWYSKRSPDLQISLCPITISACAFCECICLETGFYSIVLPSKVFDFVPVFVIRWLAKKDFCAF